MTTKPWMCDVCFHPTDIGEPCPFCQSECKTTRCPDCESIMLRTPNPLMPTNEQWICQPCAMNQKV